MPKQTEAEKKLYACYQDLDKAIKNLGSVVLRNCEGSEEFTHNTIGQFTGYLEILQAVRNGLE